jgi:hypothetical protein
MQGRGSLGGTSYRESQIFLEQKRAGLAVPVRLDLQQHQGRILQELTELREILRTDRTVDHPMVAA